MTKYDEDWWAKNRRDGGWWLPTHWPVFWRRAFLCTLPISGPIWLAGVVLCGIVLPAVLFVGCFFVMPIVELWQRNPDELT